MNSTTDDKLEDEQIARLEEQLSNLMSEAGISPSNPPTSKRTFHRPGNNSSTGGWALRGFVASLLVACIGVAAWWWSSSGHTAAKTAPLDPAPLAQAAPQVVNPTITVQSSELAEQLQSIARDVATLRQALDQLRAGQEQLARDSANMAQQLKTNQEDVARKNDNILDQLKATQTQMTLQSETIAERLNASQEQLARVIANTAEPRVRPEIPAPPRRPTAVAPTQKPVQPSAQQPTAQPQAKKPQPPQPRPAPAR